MNSKIDFTYCIYDLTTHVVIDVWNMLIMKTKVYLFYLKSSQELSTETVVFPNSAFHLNSFIFLISEKNSWVKKLTEVGKRNSF